MKNDLEALAFMLSSIALIMLTTLLFSAAAQWFAGVAWRLGLVSVAAQWTIYVMGLLLCIATMLTVAGRVVDGRWWFR